jgi:uncharacterized membrane protein YesL
VLRKKGLISAISTIGSICFPLKDFRHFFGTFKTTFQSTNILGTLWEFNNGLLVVLGTIIDLLGYYYRNVTSIKRSLSAILEIEGRIEESIKMRFE